MAQLQLKIVTPEKQIYDEPVDMVTLTSVDGQLGILPHHVNLMTKLMPGELQIKKAGKVEILAIGDGFAQIADNTLTILTDMAVDEKQIDEKAVEQAKIRAEKALEEKLSGDEYAETWAILQKSLAQLRIKRRNRSH